MPLELLLLKWASNAPLVTELGHLYAPPQICPCFLVALLVTGSEGSVCALTRVFRPLLNHGFWLGNTLTVFVSVTFSVQKLT